MTSINKKICICACGHKHNINDRNVVMYKGLVEALFKVFRWCEKNGKNEFKIKDTRHLYDQPTYSRFHDWEKFGGLVYKKKKGEYGLNMDRCKRFFAGQLKIPRVIYVNPITKAERPGELVTIHEMPYLGEFLDDNNQYIAKYSNPQPPML